MNDVLHIAAVVQLRNHTEGRAYYDRTVAAGKTSMEALRAPDTAAVRRGVPPAGHRRPSRTDPR